MIAASEPQEFVPFGRQHVRNHPGNVVMPSFQQPLQSQSFLAQRFSQVNIDDRPDDEFWILRESERKLGIEEELYVSGNTAIVSRGTVGKSVATDASDKRAARLVHTSYTMESPVKQALWCNFTTTLNQDNSSVIKSLCILDSTKISVHTSEGEDFLSSLQFKVASAWKTKYGLLLERVSHCNPDRTVTDCNYYDNLTTLFSLLHPLDEISPILAIRPGGVLTYMSDPCLKVVFTSDEPSLCVLYDLRTGLHSVWKLRKALPEECQLMCGTEYGSTVLTPMSTTHYSSSNFSANSVPSLKMSKSNIFGQLSTSNSSPYVSRAGSMTGTFYSGSPHPAVHSPSVRPHSPLCLSPKHSPAATSSIDARLGASQIPQADPKPIVPGICIEFIWSDTQTIPSNFHSGRAKKVFLMNDALGQQYLCYLVESRLVCVRLNWTNEKQPELIIGTVSYISARDAVPIPSVNMVVVLEQNSSVMLYTGTTLVGKLHIAGVSAELASSSYLTCISASHIINSPFPKRSSMLSSTRVGDGVFDEQLHLLSPVAQAYKDPAHHLHDASSSGDGICALRDPVKNRFTVEFSNGSMFRFALPEISSSPLVTECVRVLKHVLQRDVALLAIVKWYSVRNAPGTQDISPKHEWQLFIGAILDLLGYQSGSLPLMLNYTGASDCEVTAKNKKRRASDLGSQEDWDYLLYSADHDAASFEICSVLHIAHIPSTHGIGSTNEKPLKAFFNTSAPLFPYIHLILFSLHLLYEELKLNTLLSDCLPMLVRLLHQLSCDLRLGNYAHYYWRDFPDECPINAQLIVDSYESQISDSDLLKLSFPTFMTDTPPNLFEHICMMLREVIDIEPYPYIPSVNPLTRDILELVGILMNGDISNQVKQVTPPGSRCETPVDMGRSPHSDPSLPNTHKAILHMASLGMKQDDLSTMPGGLALMLIGAVQSVCESPGAGWPEEVYRLIGRLDMIPPQNSAASSANSSAPRPPTTTATTTRPCLNYHPHTDHTEHTEQVLKLRFSKDQREAEVQRMLQSSEPVTIAIQQRPEVSDHEFIEEQERHLYAICTRTMALPVGRGMMELHTATPVVSEPLAIPRLCLSGRAPPRDTTVELSHIEVVPNMNLWPLFHNGVAAGLRIAPDATNVCSTWIAYNKPKNGSEALPEHAGFLMALGLSGHLKNFDQLNMYEYLTKCHEMTSVGLLLGIAASKRGTMDVQSTKLFSIHIESLLPPTSIELDLVQNIQVAALLGIGLIYQGTANRHMAEVLLSEIGRPPGPEMDNSSDRECYALAAGLGLGLVVLGKGANPSGLDDLAIADMLHYYMVGGHKRPLTGSQKDKYKSPSYQIREGEYVNNNVTAPGATLALAMMYFNTGNMAVANWLEAPDSEYMLDFVCPDLLLLRMVARGLILWEHILPSKEWVEAHVPPSIRPYCLVKPRHDTQDSVDYETMNQAYCNIIAGACMAMGLRFAGSANNEAFTTLLYYCKMFTSLSAKSIAELAGKSTIETSINVILLSLAMVMAGTGELEVVRLCRHLRSRIGGAGGGASAGGSTPSSVVTYGSHLVTHMALGLLFLGGGSYSLSTSPESIAALICAFFPRFPTHSNDNRYHLQAFRHLYVLAVEPRLFLPKDIDTSSLCYAHITVVYLDTPHYKDQSVVMYAPCLLPELHLLKQVCIEDDRYWPVVFTRGKNWEHLEEILKTKGCIGVKQRTGCLPYVDDPHGFRTLLAQTLSTDNATSWAIPTESILGFTSDTVMLNYTKHFLESCEQNRVSTERELRLMQSLCKLSYECVTRDKLPLLRIWIIILEMVTRSTYRPSSCVMWQLRLMLAYGASRLQSHMASDLINCLRQSITATLTSYENDIGVLICSYLKSQNIMASGTELVKLASYLTFYGIPLQPEISEFFAQGPSSMFDLYSFLKPFNLEKSTMKKIWQMSKLPQLP